MTTSVYYTKYSDNIYLFKVGSLILKIDSIGSSLVDQTSEHYNHYSYYFNTVRRTISHCLGIIGTFVLPDSKYIIVAKTAKVALSLNSNCFYKLELYELLPIRPLAHVLSEDDTKAYLKLLRYHLDQASLLWCHTYDLSRSIQSAFTGNHYSAGIVSTLAQNIHGPAPSSIQVELASCFNLDYFWNQYLLSDVLSLGSPAMEFVLPLIYGFVHFTQQPSGIWFGLISRRSKHWAGTRYFRRGANSQGHVANYNETEQIVFTGERLASHLQVRGSVPVHWAEINNLQYRPPLAISTNTNIAASARHFHDIFQSFNRVGVVNLVNQSGREAPVKVAYESTLSQVAKEVGPGKLLDYVYFDFHKQCRKLNYSSTSQIISLLSEKGYSSQDYFRLHWTADGYNIDTVQKNIIRTNCMDCLDRTNVVQSVIGKWILDPQIGGDSWGLHSDFRDTWTQNGDYISKAYSGTGALKADITRTGKRFVSGAVRDLVNSVTRYLKNNFTDGFRQDSFDLFLGAFQPSQFNTQIDVSHFEVENKRMSVNFTSYAPLTNATYPSNVNIGNSPFVDSRTFHYQSWPYLLFSSSALFMSILSFPKGGTILSPSNFFLLSTCFALIAYSLYFILSNGIQFVNWPKLGVVDFLGKKKLMNNEGEIEGFKYVISEDYRVNMDKIE